MQNGSTVVVMSKNHNKTFLVFRSDYPAWDTMGGVIEPGETPEQTALREAYEETGFNVRIKKKIGKYKVKKDGFTRYSHLYIGEKISGSFKAEYPGCMGAWFDIKALPLSMTKFTRQKIIDALNGSIQGNVLRTGYVDNIHIFLLNPFKTLKYLKRQLLAADH